MKNRILLSILLAIAAVATVAAQSGYSRPAATDTCRTIIRTDTLVCHWALVADSVGGAVRLLNPERLYVDYQVSTCYRVINLGGRYHNSRYYLDPADRRRRIVAFQAEGWGSTTFITHTN
jgi:hypothetical protein